MNTSSLDTTADSRHLLGRFLRSRREATPASVISASVPSSQRRTPGLRREEVAQLAAISTTWYTWLEQGRKISLSASALARLAEVLRLTAAERAYLFELARRRDPAPLVVADDQTVPSALRDSILAMPMPAYLLDRVWKLRVWNAAATELFTPWLASGESCLLRYVFLDVSARTFICEWDKRASRLAAEFRADSALYPDDAELAALVMELQQASSLFAHYWSQHSVLAREGGRRAFNHPQRGRVLHHQVTLMPSCSPDHKLVLLLPVSCGAAERLLT